MVLPGATSTGSRRRWSPSGAEASDGNARGDGALGEVGHDPAVYADPFGDAVVAAWATGTLGLVDRVRPTGVGLVVMSAFASGRWAVRAAGVRLGRGLADAMVWRFGDRREPRLAAPPDAAARRARALRRTSRPAVLGPVGLGIFYLSNTATYYAGIEVVPTLARGADRLRLPAGRRRAGAAARAAARGAARVDRARDRGGGRRAGDRRDRRVGRAAERRAPARDRLAAAVLRWIILAASASGERTDRTGHASEAGADANVAGAVMLATTGIAYWTIALAVGHPVLPSTIRAAAWPGILGVGVIARFFAVQAFYAGAARDRGGAGVADLDGRAAVGRQRRSRRRRTRTRRLRGSARWCRAPRCARPSSADRRRRPRTARSPKPSSVKPLRWRCIPLKLVPSFSVAPARSVAFASQRMTFGVSVARK